MAKLEIWKDIKGYEGLYQVSNLGKVKSLKKHQKILKLSDNGRGYMFVGLSKNNKRKNKNVHRLVAETFISNYDNLLQVNHKDGNKNNNSVDNLEWVTQKQNLQHARENKLLIREKPIEQYDKNGKFLKIWESGVQIKRKLKINNSDVAQVCNGKRKSAGGYIWKYHN